MKFLVAACLALLCGFGIGVFSGNAVNARAKMLSPSTQCYATSCSWERKESGASGVASCVDGYTARQFQWTFSDANTTLIGCGCCPATVAAVSTTLVTPVPAPVKAPKKVK